MRHATTPQRLLRLIVAPLVVASNRGPVELDVLANGSIYQRRGAGGLVTMLAAAIGDCDATWIAAAMSDGDRARAGTARHVELPSGTVRLRAAAFDDRLYQAYYDRIANRTLWFLHHQLFDLWEPPCEDTGFTAAWQAYRGANATFATICGEEAGPGGDVYLQDYHLSLAPLLLRQRRRDVGIVHFTSCPWVDAEHLGKLPEPEARELTAGLLGADLLGFMAERWAWSFLSCCEQQGRAVDWAAQAVRADDGRQVRVRAFGVGVDQDELRHHTGGPRFEHELRHLLALAGDRRLIVRVDRMEPSKNIERGLAAYELFLEANPSVRGSVVHYVLAYTSRAHLAEYRAYRRAVEQCARRVNDRFSADGWQPVVLETEENRVRALAAMSLAHVIVVNPVRDGMNLVCKESATVNRKDAVLILSREAGAWADLGEGALGVDPLDSAELASALATAISMGADERARRARYLRDAASALPPRAWFEALRQHLGDIREAG